MRRRILLVDDDAAIRRVLPRVLTGEHYQVLTAASVAEAMRLAGERRVDLVLLDLNLAGQSGWDLFNQLSRENPATPVIIITARPNQIFPALASGAGALMEKPLDLPRLLRVIRDLLEESPVLRRARMSGKAVEFRYLRGTEEARVAARTE